MKLIVSIIRLCFSWKKEKSRLRNALVLKWIQTAWRSGLIPAGLALALVVPALYLGANYAYRHFTRIEVADNLAGEATRLRLMAYGYDDKKRSHFGKVLKLDLLMRDQIQFNDRKVLIRRLTPETTNEILSIFGVEKSEGEKLRILKEWFSKRYIPTYRAFVQALYSTNSHIYLDELDSLARLDMVDYLTKVDIPPSALQVKEVPVFDDPNTDAGKADVDQKFAVLIKRAKEEVNDSEFKAQADEIEKRNNNAREERRRRLE